jgi:anaerobic dimethyl sulfoxide reductase subunit B (iron-sulfur subunit)
MQLGFYFDQTRCTGCFTCIVACKDWNNLEAESVTWKRVVVIEKGKYPDLSVLFLSTACYHCIEPACLSSCPVEAITKRGQDGVVVVDQDKCLGKLECGTCSEACPYEAPQFGPEQDAKMQKCHFCLDRLAENKRPVCVDACPMRALDAGPMEALQAKYGNIREAEGYIHDANLNPSIIFKVKSEAKALSIEKKDYIPALFSMK